MKELHHPDCYEWQMSVTARNIAVAFDKHTIGRAEVTLPGDIVKRTWCDVIHQGPNSDEWDKETVVLTLDTPDGEWELKPDDLGFVHSLQNQ